MSQIPLEVSRRRRVIRIAVAYALVAALYIAVSDMVVVFVTHNDPGQLTGWQNIKGFCFVLFTSLALLLLLWRHDRTEQKAVQEILGARESFEQLFEATPVPLVLYHTETLGILAANPAAFVQFGCSRESLLGLTFPSLYAAGEAEKIAAHTARIGGRPLVGTFRHRRPDGTEFDASIDSRPLVFRSHPCRLIVISDQTAHQNLERKIAEAERARSEAERVKSAVLSRTSHEMRTPLNGILGFLELLRDETNPEVARRHLEVVQECAEKLLTLLDHVIRTAELSGCQVPLHTREGPLAGLLESAAATVRETAMRKGIGLEIDAAPDIPAALVADHDKLQEVLGILLGNAIKFSFDGRVILGASLAEHAGRLCLKLSISDQGIGIPSAARDLIFEQFAQADESATRPYDGLGLGLGLVRHLLALLQASIQLESAPGRGTRFDVLLPGRLGPGGAFVAFGSPETSENQTGT